MSVWPKGEWTGRGYRGFRLVSPRAPGSGPKIAAGGVGVGWHRRQVCVSRCPASPRIPQDVLTGPSPAHEYWFRDGPHFYLNDPLATNDPAPKAQEDTQNQFACWGTPKHQGCPDGGYGDILLSGRQKEDLLPCSITNMMGFQCMSQICSWFQGGYKTWSMAPTLWAGLVSMRALHLPDPTF